MFTLFIPTLHSVVQVGTRALIIALLPVFWLARYAGLVPEPRVAYTGADLVHPTIRARWTYRALVFQGGSVNGTVHVGAIRALDDVGILARCSYFAGTSIGSIFAALCAVRAPVPEIMHALMITDFSRFKGNTLEDYTEFFYRYGLYDGDLLEKWVGTLMFQFTGSHDITFAEVYKKFGTELVIPSCCLNTLEVDYMSRHTHPDFPVRRAVRFSTSIPLGFRSVPDENNHYRVDGGMVDNLPLDVFDKLVKPNDVIGLKIMRTDQTEDDLVDHALPMPITNFASYVAALLMFSSTMADRAKIAKLHGRYWNRIIRLTSPGIALTDFSISDQQKRHAIETGYNETVAQLVHMNNTGRYR